jgi:hypothetical protein
MGESSSGYDVVLRGINPSASPTADRNTRLDEIASGIYRVSDYIPKPTSCLTSYCSTAMSNAHRSNLHVRPLLKDTLLASSARWLSGTRPYRKPSDQRSVRQHDATGLVPQTDRLAGKTAIPPLSRLFMVGMGMQCRHVGVRDHGNDQHRICY